MMTTVHDLRAQLSKATNQNAADATVSGKLELPESDGLVIVRFNTDAYVEFSVDTVVPSSITAYCCKERRAVSETSGERALGLENWVHLKLKHGSKCVLHYKTVSVEFVLNRAVQQPFYIDTNALKCVYLEKKTHDPSLMEIDCGEFSRDRTNMEVIVYYKHACCCNNNKKEAYGYVSCDDGWRSEECL